MDRYRVLLIALTAVALPAAGCASSRTSNTARTATEQMLLSSAIDRALANVSFEQLRSQKVFLDDKYLDSVDKGYLLGTLRHRALAAGALLASSADKADVVVEVRSGGIGTDSEDSFIGIPSIGVPGMAISIPDIKLVSRNTQLGSAKVGLIAYDPKTGAAVGLGGQSSAISKNDNLFVFGVGPFRSGVIREERESAMGYEPPTRAVASALGRKSPPVARSRPITLVDGQVTRIAELPTAPDPVPESTLPLR
jgi:hypothetical protein